MDRGKTAGWWGCGRLAPIGATPCPSPPSPRRRVRRHFIPRRAPSRPPSPALLAAGTAAGARRAAARLWVDPCPAPRRPPLRNRIPPSRFPGLGRAGRLSSGAAQVRGAAERARTRPPAGLPGAARVPPPRRGPLRPCAAPAPPQLPAPAVVAAAAQVTPPGARRGGPARASAAVGGLGLRVPGDLLPGSPFSHPSARPRRGVRSGSSGRAAEQICLLSAPAIKCKDRQVAAVIY